MPNVILFAGTSIPAKINLVRKVVDGGVLHQRPRLLYSESELARAFDECAGMDLKRLGAGCPCCFDFDAMCEVVSGGKDFSYIVEIPPIASFSRTIDCFEQDGVLAAGDQLLAYFVIDEDSRFAYCGLAAGCFGARRRSTCRGTRRCPCLG